MVSSSVTSKWQFIAGALVGLSFSSVTFLFQERGSRLRATRTMSSSSSSSSLCTTTTVNNRSQNNGIITWPPHSQIIYGHVHLAKTAGTTVNGVLAAKFERVCGHKGYSYDAFQLNHGERDNDTISKAYGSQWNRGRVPPPAMNEIGYENCDYISLERPWSTWRTFLEKGNMELHVPCRSILEYFMSQCNYKRLQFDCQLTGEEMDAQISKCQVFPDRFSSSLVELVNKTSHLNNTMKCFNPIPTDRYIAKMAQILQPKRVPANYKYRATNKKRDKDQECIWQANNSHVATYVKEYLREHYPIHKYCDECMADPVRNLLVLDDDE